MLDRARQAVAAGRQAIAALLRWVTNLPYDSREQLGSKEQELAILGISWAIDPGHDTALAREIELARQRRRTAGELAPRGFVAARSGPPRAIRGHRRISISREAR